MPETISEGARDSLIATLESALQITLSTNTNINDAAAITHNAADGHELTEIMLQQTTNAIGYIENCQRQIQAAISAIDKIPLDPPPED